MTLIAIHYRKNLLILLRIEIIYESKIHNFYERFNNRINCWLCITVL
jgi:hypothetical protein